MESINIEKYIKDLSPEFQEKARACSNIDELLNLAEENNIPLPDEAVEAVAGGKSKTSEECPKCGSKNIYKINSTRAYCGHCRLLQQL